MQKHNVCVRNRGGRGYTLLAEESIDLASRLVLQYNPEYLHKSAIAVVSCRKCDKKVQYVVF